MENQADPSIHVHCPLSNLFRGVIRGFIRDRRSFISRSTNFKALSCFDNSSTCLSRFNSSRRSQSVVSMMACFSSSLEEAPNMFSHDRLRFAIELFGATLITSRKCAAAASGLLCSADSPVMNCSRSQDPSWPHSNKRFSLSMVTGRGLMCTGESVAGGTLASAGRAISCEAGVGGVAQPPKHKRPTTTTAEENL